MSQLPRALKRETALLRTAVALIFSLRLFKIKAKEEFIYSGYSILTDYIDKFKG